MRQRLAAICVSLFCVLAPAVLPAAAQSSEKEAGAEDAAGEEESRVQGRTGLPLPRFVSLRASEVNLRTGPGIRYPIEWVYRRRGMPVEIVDEFGNWRRIRDWQGTEGWVHQSMLRGQRAVMVTGERRLLRRRPAPDAPGVAWAEAGVVGRLLRCSEAWCAVRLGSFEGWLRRSEVYGLLPGETPD